MKSGPKIKRNWPKEWEQGLIRTNNQMGVMVTELSPASEAFINFSRDAHKPVLDIGAAYGLATYRALEEGASLIALDLDQHHLNILQSNIPAAYKDKLTTQCAAFPSDVEFDDNALSAILASQVLHFLDGNTVMQGLEKCYRWLEPGGKLFIVVVTHHLSFYSQFTAEFNRRYNTGELWPGLIDPRDLATEEWDDLLPPLLHLFDKPIIERACQRVGFEIETCDYFTFKSIDKKHQTNGKGWISLIATKNSY